MRSRLLWAGATTLLVIGCKHDSQPVMKSDTLITVGPATMRDTIIMYAYKDTIIMHVATLPDSCKKVPRPPGCHTPVAAAVRDTIIR